jgi:hypothetical protein
MRGDNIQGPATICSITIIISSRAHIEQCVLGRLGKLQRTFPLLRPLPEDVGSY